MKTEAIEALRLFKEQLNQQPTPTVDIESLRYPPKETGELVQTPATQEPKGKAINYPAHIKSLKDRIMSALNNGNRTAEAVAGYCKEDNVKLVNLQLGRWVSRGMIGKHTNPQSGITRFYPYDEAKKRGILQKPAPINRKKTKFIKPKSLEKAVVSKDPRQMDLFIETPPKPSKDQTYIAFLENRMSAWQAEARKQAHEIEELKAKLSEAQVQLIEVRQTRDVTSEVTEVMVEVRELRATIAYLESKLFGSK